MAFLMKCGVCCLLLSIWAVIQLGLMGIFYFIEACVLIEDAEAHEYEGYDEFIAKTQKQYKQLAINCWLAAGMYAFTLAMAYFCTVKARKKEIQASILMADDEYSCTSGLPVAKKVKPI